MSKVLITGCRNGIALDVACRLLKRGHTVYATVHRAVSVNDVRAALRSYGEDFVVDSLDITKPSDIDKVDNWDVDVLVNNAAIGDSGPLAEIDLRRIAATFDTNVFSALRLTQKVIPKLIENGRGRIIFMGSMAGTVPTPFYAPYGMTKFALESVASSLRTELKPFGIKVIIINPGVYRTGFNESFMSRKYEWMDAQSLYKDHMAYVRRADWVMKLGLPSTWSIARQVVRAVEARWPRRRYIAPAWEWVFLPIFRWFG
ncbi:MAG TPA: SDR family oxidoreductase [Candidatus Bathyarchaeia archaeon]|nr:SDR family oxidoreductase [Candidatus Bathyarchaeia archaeon]